MKIMLLSLVTFLVATLTAACAPEPPAAIEQATVNAEHASLRTRDSTTSPTLEVLEPGDRVEILGQEGRWYRVRLGTVQGWMETTTLLTNAVRDKIRENVEAARNQVPQNTGVLTQDGNLRLNPGRSTHVLRLLPSHTAVEVLDRTTLPREDLPGRVDAWLKVRTNPEEVGWLLSSFVEFDVPDEIARYTENYSYTAVKTVNEIQDPVAGTVRWYVVGERRPGSDPYLDFEGVRVFTWNSRRQRYETAFRDRDLRGVYPLEVGRDSGRPTFRIYELSADGETRQPKDFEMYGVIVREVQKTVG